MPTASGKACTQMILLASALPPNACIRESAIGVRGVDTEQGSSVSCSAQNVRGGSSLRIGESRRRLITPIGTPRAPEDTCPRRHVAGRVTAPEVCARELAVN